MVLQLPAPYSVFAMPVRRRAYNRSDTEPGTLGDFIRRMREDELNLTQPQFAALVDDNMDASDVSQLERGKVGLPKPPRMIALANALGIPVVALYAEAGFPEFLEGIPAQFFREWKLSLKDRERDQRGGEKEAS